MQYLKISTNQTLKQLSDIVGARNVDNILHLNGLERSPSIGKQVYENQKKAIEESNSVDWQKKVTLLNSVAGDSDIFERVALQNEQSWKLFASTNQLPRMIRIPDGIKLPDSEVVIGNGEQVRTDIYNKVIDGFKSPPHYVDSVAFGEYSSITPSVMQHEVQALPEVFQWFKIPWGEVSLYSSLSDTMVDFPVYPETVNDAVRANYTQMPDLIYQYEPWQLYQSSGPRANTYEFHFHRDMWTGDHRDGKANELIRFCMANCYPKYDGSAVNTATVNLYIGGKSVIQGVMTDVSVAWSGPLGLDNWYLDCILTLNITEVSPRPLNYESMMTKPLIGW